ncbi:MAG: hypothetical protein AABZ60_11530, partial [Planctomycetota bacterium]
ESNASTMADLYTIDLGTGDATIVGSTGLMGVSDIEYANGILYAVTSGTGTGSGELYRLNTGTGANTLVGSLGSTCDTICGMAFDTSNGTMYGYGVFNSGTTTSCPGDHVTINLTTGAVTPINSNFSNSDSGGLAYSTTDNILYILSQANGLATVNPATGAKTTFTAFSGGTIMTRSTTGSVHPTTNVLYGAGEFSNLYTIDTETAETTLFSAPGIGFIDGLAFGN